MNQKINKIKQILKNHKQEHLCADLSSLKDSQINYLYSDLEKLEKNFRSLKKEVVDVSSIKPFEYPSKMDISDNILGREALQKGKVGCIVLAGGEGSRLGFSHPKGMFPITSDRTLFQIIVERVLVAQKRFSTRMYLAIMVSPLGKKETISFFQENLFFGLEEEQLDFFEQDLNPYEDNEGKWFFHKKGRLAQGPLGNGRVFFHFSQSGLLRKWQQKGIEYSSLINVDNPLADPYDAAMIGIHLRNQSDITIKAIPKEKKEKTGSVFLIDNIPRIIEYDAIEKLSLESCPVFFGNSGIYLISLVFIQKVAETSCPACRVENKTTKLIGENEKEVLAFKWEYRVFDTFFHTNKVTVFSCPREKCFAPLKNKNDIENIQKALKDNSPIF